MRAVLVVTGVLAELRLRQGRLEEEAQAGQRGLVVPGIHSGMADCLARLGREAEAEREFQAEIYPRDARFR